MTRGRALLVAGFGCACISSASAAADPPGSLVVSRDKSELAFSIAVVMGCLTAVERSAAFATLPEVYRTGLEPAHGADLKLGSLSVPEGRGWTSTLLGSHLRVFEVSPDRCEIVADQIPVEDTLRRTQEVASRLSPPFTAVDVKPGYNPVVLESRRTAGGRRITIHLEGAEPGLPGHWYRSSLLRATVSGAPE